MGLLSEYKREINLKSKTEQKALKLNHRKALKVVGEAYMNVACRPTCQQID